MQQNIVVNNITRNTTIINNTTNVNNVRNVTMVASVKNVDRSVVNLQKITPQQQRQAAVAAQGTRLAAVQRAKVETQAGRYRRPPGPHTEAAERKVGFAAGAGGRRGRAAGKHPAAVAPQAAQSVAGHRRPTGGAARHADSPDADTQSGRTPRRDRATRHSEPPDAHAGALNLPTGRWSVPRSRPGPILRRPRRNTSPRKRSRRKRSRPTKSRGTRNASGIKAINRRRPSR